MQTGTGLRASLRGRRLAVLRQAHRITPEMVFVVSAVGDEIRLRPAPLFAPSTHAQAAGCLHRKGRKRVTDAGMNEAVRERAKRLDDGTKTGSGDWISAMRCISR